VEPARVCGPSTGQLRLDELVLQVRNVLRGAGIEPAPREARLLIGALTQVTPETFLAHPEMIVSPEQLAEVTTGLQKRLAGMPLGRIVGEREFYGRPFSLGPATLEPRADSEVLIDAVLEIVRQEDWTAKPIRIIDVGTGTGCLLITLLAELPQAIGVGIDISANALRVAQSNADAIGVASRAMFREGDLLTGVTGTYDLLISNPPYIRSDDIASLDRQVSCHDPILALDGGADGLDCYRRIAADVGRVVPNGWMLYEIGAGMAEAVCLEMDGINGQDRKWQVWHDLNGHVRCVAAKTL